MESSLDSMNIICAVLQMILTEDTGTLGNTALNCNNTLMLCKGFSTVQWSPAVSRFSYSASTISHYSNIIITTIIIIV